MSNEQQIEKLAALFKETGNAHHEAFAATDGEDPDWAIWYADYIQARVSDLLDTQLTRSQLIYCLMFVEFERAARSPDAEWTAYYADHLVEWRGPVDARVA